MCTFPETGEQSDTLPFCFSAHTVNKYPFGCLFSVKFFTFLHFLLVISLFKMAPKHRAEVLSSVPKHKKTMMCLMKKMHVGFFLLTACFWLFWACTLSAPIRNLGKSRQVHSGPGNL